MFSRGGLLHFCGGRVVSPLTTVSTDWNAVVNRLTTFPLLFLFPLLAWSGAFQDSEHCLIVGQSETADFNTLTAALESLPMFTYERYEIFLEDGIYEEKVRIENDHITVRGESREGTVIRYAIPRPEWIERPDTIGPGVVNIFANDVILQNLTVENSQRDQKIHAFAVYGMGTRTILDNCNIWSEGGDTVSLWNYQDGVYYHRDCDFRGAVDFVCPRGWCLIEDSSFFCVRNTAAIWHAGGWDKDQKLVLNRCRFDGRESFDLGRHHYDAQFYFVDCEFSDKVSDRAIYRVVHSDPTKNRPNNWGHRAFFHNSSGVTYSWMSSSIGGATQTNVSNMDWVFSSKWNPKEEKAPVVVDLCETDTKLRIDFEDPMTVWGSPVISYGGFQWKYLFGGGSRALHFEKTVQSNPQASQSEFEVTGGEIFVTSASISKRIWGSKR